MEKLVELNTINCLVQARHGLFLANRYDFYLGYALVCYGEYGQFEWELLEQLIEPGSIVVEVGANIGTHTISLAKSVGSEGRVIAIEPQRVIFQYLCANISLNGLMNVETYNCGCGCESGTLLVPPINYSAETRQNFGGVSLKPTGDGETVQILRLDDLIGEKRRVSLIKIDVEGMEVEVLKGAIATIEESRPILYVENDRPEKSDELIRFLFGLGYRLYWHVPGLFNPENFFGEKENVYGNVASYNMLCFPNETETFLEGLEEIVNPAYHPLIPDLPMNEMIDLALTHYNARRFSIAELLYLKVITNGTATAELYKNYGNTLLSLNRNQEAEKAFLKALELDSDYAAAYNNLGNLLRLEQRYAESEDAFKKALALLPDNAEIHNNFGLLLMDLGYTEDAEKLFRQAILLKPDYALAYRNRGNALRADGRLKVAAKCYRQAIEFDPGYVDAYIGLGQTLLYLDDKDEAEKHILHALELYPGFANAYCTMGNIHLARGLVEEAEAAYLRAITTVPEYASAQFNLSLVKLLKGDLLEGFALYEKRFLTSHVISFRRIQNMFRALKDKVRWTGEQVAAKTLLIITEQGAGDSLMMMRYLPQLKQRGFDRLHVYCDAGFVRLFQTVSVVDEMFSKADPLDLTSFDCYCPLMSLPYLFQTSLDSIPATVPYFEIPDAERGQWRTLLAGVSGLKVGLVWAGSCINLIDKQRSIPISEFRPLAIIDGINLISLQKGEQEGQCAELGSDCIDYMDRCHDYLDTAALIMELDLVISVDTSVAHLTGALGKPVWLLNRFGSEWRWMLDREDSPWYPSMRIFNQKEAGNWAPVIDAVVVELKSLIAKKNNI